jgi:hypothetical protein
MYGDRFFQVASSVGSDNAMARARSCNDAIFFRTAMMVSIGNYPRSVHIHVIYIYNPTYTYHLYIMWQRVKYCAIFKHMINNVISYNNTCMQIYWKYTAISKKLTKNVSKCNSMEFHSSLKLRFSKMVEKDSWRLWLRSILWPKSWTDCTLQLPVLVDFILQKSSKIDTIYSIYPAIREIHWNPILIWGIS